MTVVSVHGGSFSQNGFGRYQINLPDICGFAHARMHAWAGRDAETPGTPQAPRLASKGRGQGKEAGAEAGAEADARGAGRYTSWNLIGRA